MVYPAATPVAGRGTEDEDHSWVSDDYVLVPRADLSAIFGVDIAVNKP